MSTARTKGTQRAGVVMAGVAAAAMTAAGGADAASAAPVPQVTSGVIYACYSHATGELTHTTKTTRCSPGETLLSWNAKGPQGPIGPQGVRGPQGATGPKGPQGPPGPEVIRGYVANARIASSFDGLSGSMTVASVAPTSSGAFIVNGDVANGGGTLHGLPVSWGCRIVRLSTAGKSLSGTPWGYGDGHTVGTVATTGAVFATPQSPLVMRCKAVSGSLSSIHGAMTAVKVTSVNGAPAARPAHPQVANRFSPLRHHKADRQPR